MVQIALVLLAIILGTGLILETLRLKRGVNSLLPALTAVDNGLASLTQNRQAPASGFRL